MSVLQKSSAASSAVEPAPPAAAPFAANLINRNSALQLWCAGVLIYLQLVGFSLLRVLLPAVNEPHYLCKAKHFWQPEWCAGDPFLESSNPHVVFYVAFGWLTYWFSLDAVALIGRLIGLVPLAIGWQRLVTQLTGRIWTGPLALSIFLTLHSAGNWSGEWLVGGIESKVLAYGCLFWSCAEALRWKLPASALLAGLSVSFHPVVGVWGTLAAALGAGLLLCSLAWTGELTSLWQNRNWVQPRQFALAALLFGITAAPGVYSAAGAVFEGDAEANRVATLLQVGHRLAHHLDPLAFPKEAYRYFILQLVLWGVLLRQLPSSLGERWWRYLVISSLLFAMVGIAIGWGPRPLKEMPGYEWRISLLKFYPFRLADLLVPVTLSLACVQQFVHWQAPHSLRNWQTCGLWAVLLVGFWTTGLIIPGTDQNPSKMSPEKRANWIAACEWLHANSKPSDLIYSFDNQWAVKWYAQRPEYVNYKDCPQDAAALIEWNRRRWVISRWRASATKTRGISEEELSDLARLTGIRFIICDRFGPLDPPPVYQNQDFRVYELRESQESMVPAG